MKIYTYHEDFGFKQQQELIRLWHLSWYNLGFEPIVLGIDDARKHREFEKFNNEMKNICNNIKSPNKQHKVDDQYVLSCHRRWLAYSTQEHEPFLVSDYDVINLNLKHNDELIKNLSINKVHFLNNLCPCLAFGTPRSFENFAKDLLTKSNDNLINKKKWDGQLYHDQEVLLQNEIYFRQSNNYNFSNDANLWRKLKHYSHNYTMLFKNMDVDKLRIQLIKNDLRINRN
jgi:hypothetical protein